MVRSVLNVFGVDYNLVNFDFIYRVEKVRKNDFAVSKNGKRNCSYCEERMHVVVNVFLCVYPLKGVIEKDDGHV